MSNDSEVADDYLSANLAAVATLLAEARHYGDAVGEFQLAIRQKELEAEFASRQPTN